VNALPPNSESKINTNVVLAWFTLWPFNWRQRVPPKRRWTYSELHSVTYQKTVLFIVTTRCCWCVINSCFVKRPRDIRPLVQRTAVVQSSHHRVPARVRRVEVTSDPLNMIDCYAFQWRANFRHVNINRNSFWSGLKCSPLRSKLLFYSAVDSMLSLSTKSFFYSSLNLVPFNQNYFHLQWTEFNPTQLNVLSLTEAWI
jgi:hypothetical protein